MSLNDHKIQRDGEIGLAPVDHGAIDARKDKQLVAMTKLREEMSVREEELNTREAALDRREVELGRGLAAIKERERDVSLRQSEIERRAKELDDRAAALDEKEKKFGSEPLPSATKAGGHGKHDKAK